MVWGNILSYIRLWFAFLAGKRAAREETRVQELEDYAQAAKRIHDAREASSGPSTDDRLRNHTF